MGEIRRADAGSTGERAGRGAGLGVLQRLGRSLMLPIAALPVAALLLRLGQPDMLGAGDSGLALGSRWPWLEPVAMVLAAAGGTLFANLGLLFAVGVAVGFARKSDGSTALAAVVGYLVFDAVTEAMSPYVLESTPSSAPVLIDYGVFGGILIGIMAALLWQRYYRVKLPPYLAFFGGRRFVPILTANGALMLAVAMSFVYPAFDRGLTELGSWLVGNEIVGAGIYGFVNRLLIPFGLHHLVNSVPWFVVGSFETASGEVGPRRHRSLPQRRPDGGGFHDGVLPDHDVRAAGGRAGDLPRGEAGQAEARRRRDALGRADVVPYGGDRAARVRLHVRRLAALPDPRLPHRHRAGAGERAWASRTGSRSRPGRSTTR